MQQSGPQPDTGFRGPMAAILVALAMTPDDRPDIDGQLNTLIQMVVDRVGGAEYASVTAVRDGAYSTVATSSEVAEEIDRAQYMDDQGPCLQALQNSTPIAVPDIDRTMVWPGFRETAVTMGLHASVSIPLYTGSGGKVAVLNVYGRDAAALAPLIAGVQAMFDPDLPLPADREDLPPLDPGGEELLTGFAESLAVRSTIQLAMEIVRSHTGDTAEDAYIILRLQAAEMGVTLLAAASTVIARAHR